MLSTYDLKFLSEISYLDLTYEYIKKYGLTFTNNINHTFALDQIEIVRSLDSYEKVRDEWELVLTLQAYFHQGNVKQAVKNKVIKNEKLAGFLFWSKTSNEFVITFRGTNFSIFKRQFWKDMAENLNPLFLLNLNKERQVSHAINFVMVILNYFLKSKNIMGSQFEAYKPLNEPFTVYDISFSGHSKGGGLVHKVIYYYNNILNIFFSNNSTTFCAPPLFVSSVLTKKGEHINFNQLSKEPLPMPNYKCKNYSISKDRVISFLSNIYIKIIKTILLINAVKKTKYNKVIPIIKSKINLSHIGSNIHINSNVKSLYRHEISKMFEENFDNRGNLL